MPHEIPAGLLFVFCFSCFFFSDETRGSWPARQGSSRPLARVPAFCTPLGALLRPSKPHRRPLFCNWVTSRSSLYHGWRRWSAGRAWRQPFTAVMALLPRAKCHMSIARSGRPVLPRSQPEQVVVEVDLASQKSPRIGNAKRHAPARQAQYSNSRTMPSCDPWFPSTHILLRGHLGWPRSPAQMLTAARRPGSLHCTVDDALRAWSNVLNKVFCCTGNLLRYAPG